MQGRPGAPPVTSTPPTTPTAWPAGSRRSPTSTTAGSCSCGTTARVLRVLGGSCVHDPPRGFASPNGDTPLADGGLLVTEIGGWIDRLDRAGRLVWSVRSPVSYPSDAQLLPDGRILVCSFTTPGRVVELTRDGTVVWSFGATTGPDRLDRPSLAIGLPNGLIAINDDWRHRVIVVDPHSNRIVWQYGHTDVASAEPGYLNKPDGMDFLPASVGARVETGDCAARRPDPDRHASLADLARRRRRPPARPAGGAGRTRPRDVVGRRARRTAGAARSHRQPAVADARRRGRSPPRAHRALRRGHGGLGSRRHADRPIDLGDAPAAPPRRAALRPRGDGCLGSRLSRRRIHGEPLRQRDPARGTGRPDGCRCAAAGRPPLRGRHVHRSGDLRRRRADARRPLGRAVPRRRPDREREANRLAAAARRRTHRSSRLAVPSGSSAATGPGMCSASTPGPAPSAWPCASRIRSRTPVPPPFRTAGSSSSAVTTAPPSGRSRRRGRRADELLPATLSPDDGLMLPVSLT